MKYLRIVLMIAMLIPMISTVTLAGKKTAVKTNQPATENDSGDKINWVKYEDGLKQAKVENKHIFIDFSTSWCGWCKKMDKTTFSKKEVIDMIDQYFIAVRVDGDSKREMDIDGYKISEKDLTKKEFGVRGYPAFWFLDSEGEKLGQISGYRDAAFMMQAFKYIKDKMYDTTSSGGNSQEGE